ncbi:MAG: IS30 family transposase [Propionibacteriaceae bacterium]|nr:IS30 family transposase [Micropruina sp.]
MNLTEVQDKYLKLIEQGVNNSEACRIVGINRRTGTRWRFGRTIQNNAGEAVHYPPVTVPTPPTARHRRYLSIEEREAIADLRKQGHTLRQIAALLGRNASTISRELRRNVDGQGRYRPVHADRLAQARTARPRPRRLVTDRILREVVVDRLGKRWSPEQVAHELRAEFAEHRQRQLCAESIYQALYDPDIDVTRPARRRRRRRRRQLQGLERRGHLLNMTMIDDRPAEVADRVQPGHWESQWSCQAVRGVFAGAGSW